MCGCTISQHRLFNTNSLPPLLPPCASVHKTGYIQAEVLLYLVTPYRPPAASPLQFPCYPNILLICEPLYLQCQYSACKTNVNVQYNITQVDFGSRSYLHVLNGLPRLWVYTVRVSPFIVGSSTHTTSARLPPSFRYAQASRVASREGGLERDIKRKKQRGRERGRRANKQKVRMGYFAGAV